MAAVNREFDLFLSRSQPERTLPVNEVPTAPKTTKQSSHSIRETGERRLKKKSDHGSTAII